MKVVSYLGGIPNLNKTSEKQEMLERFVEGVRACGDQGIAHQDRTLVNADVGVIQGFVHEGSPRTPHLRLRKNVAANTHNRHTIIIDSNLFNYTGIYKQYHRYSMDDVFPNTGNYFSREVDPSRWQQISRDYNIALKDWRSPGHDILLCLQRNNGWSMAGMPVTDWLRQTVKRIRKSTDRAIVVRAHPGDKKSAEYLPPLLNELNLEQSKNPSIVNDFNRSWAVVTYNSSPAVAAAIEGIPVFVTDPFPNRSQALPVANTVLSKIENPDGFERQPWIERVCMSHWNFEELSNGSAWQHMRGYCQ